MKILEQIPLAQYTTFNIGGPARYFCSVADERSLLEAVMFVQEKHLPMLVIGGGSNLLISDTGFSGLVIRMEMKGIEDSVSVTDSNNTDSNNIVLVSAAAGEDWENFVGKMVDQGLCGLENLSSIPGTVGASPVQNIGAYGVDVSNCVESVRVLDTTTLGFLELPAADCKFSYRHSIFKEQKGRYIITRVTYKLTKNGKVDISYKDLADYFAKRAMLKMQADEVSAADNSLRNILPATPTLQEVRQAVIEIRKSKLPDWKMWGTAGSFFKNPIISAEKFNELKVRYPEIPAYEEPDGKFKVSLGWILDKLCNAKGLTIGNVGTYEKQALVVVAKPGATAAEVIDFTGSLMKCVKEKTGIEIEAEVEWTVV